MRFLISLIALAWLLSLPASAVLDKDSGFTQGSTTTQKGFDNVDEELVELYERAPATATGVSGTNDISFTFTPEIAATPTDGQAIIFTAVATSTSTVRFITSGGAPINAATEAGVNLGTGDIVNGQTYMAVYKASENKWRVIVRGGGAGGGGAPSTADYLTLTNNGSLSAERAFTPSTGLAATDGGADSTYTLLFDFSDAGTDPALTAGQCRFSNEGASAAGWVCEGETADAFEARFRVTDPTADRIITFPNVASATAAAITCAGTDRVSAFDAATGLFTCTAITGGSATGFFASGFLEVTRGGNGAAPAGDDQVVVSSSSSAATWVTIPDSEAAGTVLGYDIDTNAFSTKADDDVPEDGDFTALFNDNTQVWGSGGGFTTAAFDAGASDPTWTYASGSTILSAQGSSPVLGLDDQGELRLFEEDGGGDHYLAMRAPSSVTATATCTFENDANFIPDSCVGDGVDDGAGAAAPTNATYITVSTNATLTDERTATAGTGMTSTDAGAGSTFTFDVVAGVGLATAADSIAFDFTDAGASPALAADTCRFTGDATTNGEIVCEGDTADAIETRIVITDPTGADQSFTIINGISYSLADADKGDITVGTSGTDFQIDSGAVTTTELATNAVDLVDINDDAVGIDELDLIDADTPVNGDCLTYDTGAGGTIEAITCPGAGGGDSITVNTTAVVDPDFDSATPVAPAGGYNVTFQTAANDISAYVNFTGATDLTALAVADSLLVNDASVPNAIREITVADFFEVINTFTEDTAPNHADDFIEFYDTSAGTVDKVNPERIGAGKQPIALLAGAGTRPTGGGIAACTIDDDVDSGSNDVFWKECEFSASVDNALYWTVPAPKSSDETVDWTARIDWTSATTTDGSDNVIWTAASVCFSNDDAINGNAFPAVDTVTDTQTASGDFLSTAEITGITPAGTWAENDVCVIRVTRDADAAGDNFNGTADLINAQLYVTTNANTEN